MQIEYMDLNIQNAKADDAQILAKWWNDGKVMAHAGFPNGLNTTPERIADDLETQTDETRRTLMIRYKNLPIGEMNYINLGNSVAEIGIKICEEQYQNKGLGKIILSLFIKELFKTGFTKIKLDTNLKNTRAQHVYETLGFQKIAVNYNSWKDRLGNFQSSVDYELVKCQFVDFS